MVYLVDDYAREEESRQEEEIRRAAEAIGMSIAEYKKRAADTIEQKRSEELNRLREENAKLKEEIADLKFKIGDLKDRLHGE